MTVNQDELVFVGRMGNVPIRAVGSVTIYCAIDRPFQFRLSGGEWEQRRLAVVPPFVQHEFSDETQAMAAVMIEAETIAHAHWPAIDCANVDFQTLRTHLKTLYGNIASGDDAFQDYDPSSWREIAFRQRIPRPEIDLRIAEIASRIRQEPWQRFSAEECARSFDISFSRFLHLFSQQTGIPFRRFLAWKRARRVLDQLGANRSLTDIALEAGYPDSSHFSHSIRQVYGLQPRDMFARCAEITLLRS